MNKDRSLICLFGTYAAILLLATVICMTVIFSRLKKPPLVITETVTHTDHVYVYLETDEASVSETTSNAPLSFTAREFEGVIGIFDSNEKLIQIIEVYTNTLPEADRRLLREGIKINSKRELYSLIEDYTG